MKYLKVYENKNVKDVLAIQDEYENLGIVITRYLSFNKKYVFSVIDCSLKSFTIGSNISVTYRNWNYDDKNIKIDLKDFLLFFNDEEEYKRLYKVRKESDKYNL